MTALPAASSFTGATVTEAQFKTATTDQRAFLAGLLGTDGTQAAALTTLGATLNGVLSKSAAYTVVAADRGKLIDYTTAGVTLTLPTVATAGAGFVIGVKNSAASGFLYIGRNSANIDGAAADIALNPTESCLIVCDGSGWKTVGKTLTPEYGVLLGVYSRFTSGTSLIASRPSGATKARIMVQGGGGGGASSNSAGGGGGAYAEAIKSVTGDLTVTVGAGGAGGINGYAGSAGGTSSVSGSGFTTITVAGGAGSSTGAGGSAPTTGDINLTGFASRSGIGLGGESLYGQAGYCTYGNAGTAGLLGAGGGGGWWDYSHAPGGAGGAGFVIIYWYK